MQRHQGWVLGFLHPKANICCAVFCRIVQVQISSFSRLLHNFRWGIEILLNQRPCWSLLMQECPFFTAFPSWCSDVATEKCITIQAPLLSPKLWNVYSVEFDCLWYEVSKVISLCRLFKLMQVLCSQLKQKAKGSHQESTSYFVKAVFFFRQNISMFNGTCIFVNLMRRCSKRESIFSFANIVPFFSI